MITLAGWMMKLWMKRTLIIIWMFLFFYLRSVFDVPENIYYILIGFPLLLGGIFFIGYLFERESYGNGKD